MATWLSTKYIDTLSYILKHPFINIRRTFRDIWSLCVKFSLLFRENSFCLIIISIILLLLSSVIVMSSHTVIMYSPCSRCLSGPWLFGLVKCLVKRWSWLRRNSLHELWWAFIIVCRCQISILTKKLLRRQTKESKQAQKWRWPKKEDNPTDKDDSNNEYGP